MSEHRPPDDIPEDTHATLLELPEVQRVLEAGVHVAQWLARGRAAHVPAVQAMLRTGLVTAHEAEQLLRCLVAQAIVLATDVIEENTIGNNDG